MCDRVDYIAKLLMFEQKIDELGNFEIIYSNNWRIATCDNKVLLAFRRAFQIPHGNTVYMAGIEFCICNICLYYSGVLKMCSTEVCLMEVCPKEFCPTEVCPTEVFPMEVCLMEICLTEVCPTEVCPMEVCLTEVGPTEVYPTEVCLMEVWHSVWIAFSPGIPSLHPLPKNAAMFLVRHNLSPKG